MSLFPLFYAGNLVYFRKISQADAIVFDVHENYPKQTYRNRFEILGPNGLHKLSIPIKKTGRRMSSGEALISYEENWQKDHWKGIEAAYRRSPYFEYYEDRFKPLFFSKPERLFDYNMGLLNLILQVLKQDIHHSISTSYQSPEECVGEDFRAFDFRTPDTVASQKYIQVFNDRHAFMPNMSILDALFNLGPSAQDLMH